LRHIITQADAEDAARIAELSAEESVGKKRSSDETAILICTHAAPLIAIGRALTGEMPVDMCQQDFKTNTCGISKFKRRTLSVSQSDSELPLEKVELPITSTAGLRYSKGIVGGWDCVMNSDGAHLEGGEERGW